MPFKTRKDIHLARRIFHSSGVLIMFGLYWSLPPRQAAIVAIVCSAFMISVDTARLFSRKLNRVFLWVFGPVLRDKELLRPAGSTAMMAGVTLIILFFPKNVVLLTLIFFALADPLASYFGIKYGRDKLVGEKSLQGSSAAFAVCFVSALVFYLTMGLMGDRLFIACLLSGLIGAVAELVPVGRLDDNFVFPVTAATLLTGLFYLFGGLT